MEKVIRDILEIILMAYAMLLVLNILGVIEVAWKLLLAPIYIPIIIVILTIVIAVIVAG